MAKGVMSHEFGKNKSFQNVDVKKSSLRFFNFKLGEFILFGFDAANIKVFESLLKMWEPLGRSSTIVFILLFYTSTC